MQQKIVLIGGPSSGKTSVINKLIELGYYCMPEISRDVTLKAKEKGIDQLFLTEPLLFSKMLLEGREQQFITAEKLNHSIVFFDRGLPDVPAYLDFFNTDYPSFFLEKSKTYRYTKVFHFLPWQNIHTTDNERYESFEEALKIDKHLQKTYTNLGYKLIPIPFDSVNNRALFIINALKSD